MLTKLNDRELNAVNGGVSTARIFNGLTFLFSTLGTIAHSAGDSDDPKGEHTVFTERTANIITFICSCASALCGAAALIFADEIAKATVKTQ
jgi:hypothetical protein